MEDCNHGYCNFCEGRLKYRSIGDVRNNKEWLECIECEQRYELDGTLIVED